MELVVQLNDEAAFEAALAGGAQAVAWRLPLAPSPEEWSSLRTCRLAASAQGVKFYLVWEVWPLEAEMPAVLKMLPEIAWVHPEALRLADVGLHQEVRQRYPEIRLEAARAWDCHNSLGLRLAGELGCRRVVLAAPVSLKELALMRRLSSLELEVVLASGLRPLWREFSFGAGPELGGGRAGAGAGESRELAAGWQAALERLPGLLQLGLEAVQVPVEGLRPTSVRELVALVRDILKAPTAARPALLAAAAEVVQSFAGAWQSHPAAGEEPGEAKTAGRRAPVKKGWPGQRPSAGGSEKQGQIWLEARGMPEAAQLARQWQGTLMVQLTPANYQAFLQEYRYWQERRRLVWRLPPVMREQELPFFRQALTTLREGGFVRYVAGDWGGVALIKEVGGLIFADHTLGIRHLKAVNAAGRLGIERFCLPAGLAWEEWQRLLRRAPAGSWWAYLYQVPVLAVSGGEDSLPDPDRPGGSREQRLRWMKEDGLSCLCPKKPVDFCYLKDWLSDQGVSPLVIALPRTGLPWGQAPPPRERKPAKELRRERQLRD